MNLKDFKSGSYVQEKEYKNFLPEKINHTWFLEAPYILITALNSKYK